MNDPLDCQIASITSLGPEGVNEKEFTTFTAVVDLLVVVVCILVYLILKEINTPLIFDYMV